MIFEVILNMYIYKLTSSYVRMYVVATVNLATIKYITMKITLTYAPGFCLSISSEQQTVCFQ